MRHCPRLLILKGKNYTSKAIAPWAVTKTISLIECKECFDLKHNVIQLLVYSAYRLISRCERIKQIYGQYQTVISEINSSNINKLKLNKAYVKTYQVVRSKKQVP